MQIGLIGLGKMGGNLALNMVDSGHEVIGLDPSNPTIEGVKTVKNINEMINALKPPRAVWVMVPAGKITDDVLDELYASLDKGDTVIEGGNSNYKSSVTRAQRFIANGLNYIDAGVSGGTEGARYGASLMVGGDSEVVKRFEPLFIDVATENGYGHMGANGAGHYVKMIHNGIEYGMMQSLAEGFALLEKSAFNLDFETVSKTWSHGSIIESYLLDTIQAAFKENPTLEGIEGIVDFSGEADWTLEDAIEKKVATPAIAASLFARYKSKDEALFTERVLAAMRGQFGGHKVHKK